MTRSLRRYALGGCALVFCADLLAYFPAIRGEFVWDDRDYVTRAALRSLHGLWLIWFKVGATEQYYPVLHSAFWLEHRLWGDAVVGYHLINVFLHASAACLFVAVLRRLAVPGAWLAGALFALHPVCVESVAQISEQKNTLSAVFYLLAAFAYLSFEGNMAEGARRSAARYALATALFAAALLSKTTTATLPAALLVVLWWRRGRLSGRRDLLPLAPWFALGALAGLFSAWVERTYIGAQGADFALSFAGRCLAAGREIWFYLGKLLWPANLAFVYPRWTVDPRVPGQYWYPLGAAALLAALLLGRRRTRGLCAAMIFFVISLFPTMGFLNVYAMVYSYVADHWQYLASLGIFAAAAAGWAQWRSAAAARTPPILAAAGVVCLLGFLAWRQSALYRNPATLYRATLQRNPSCWMAYDNLGVILADAGQLPEAIRQYRSALELKPDYPEAHNNLGNAFARSARLPEAIAQYEEAVRLNPSYVLAHENLGIALRATGRLRDAAAEFAAALRLDPGDAQVHNALAIVLAQTGQLPEAIAELRRAIQLEPNNADMQDTLAHLLRLKAERN